MDGDMPRVFFRLIIDNDEDKIAEFERQDNTMFPVELTKRIADFYRSDNMYKFNKNFSYDDLRNTQRMWF